MSIQYTLNLTTVKVSGNLIVAYWRKVGTSESGATASYSGVSHFSIENPTSLDTSSANIKQLIQNEIAGEKEAAIEAKISQQLGG